MDYAKNAYICVQISNAKNMWAERVYNKTLSMLQVLFPTEIANKIYVSSKKQLSSNMIE